jgi:hypothetical protein
VDSSCFVRLDFETSTSTVSLEKAYSIESTLSNYFDDLARESKELSSVNPFRFHVDVTDHIYADNVVSVTAITTLLYEYNEQNNVEPLVIDQVLNKLVASSKQVFQVDGTTVSFEFSAAAVPNKFLEFRDPKGKSPSEVVLFIITILLSILLVITSSVLLYISGGWAVCKRAVINCLFEEVDDDLDNPHPVQHKTTYTRSDDDQGDEENDEESNITSVAPTSASGMLGVRGPAGGLGAQMHGMDDEDDESSMTYGDNSPNGHGNIGISKGHFTKGSPKGDAKAFSGMMVQRFGRPAGKLD